jgi:hypothetical protein
LNTIVEDVLRQLDGNDPYGIYYVSKNHSPAKLNYTINEKEFLAEKKGGTRRLDRDAEDFSTFINTMEMVDIKTSNGQFTKATSYSDEARQILGVGVHHSKRFNFRLQHPSLGGFIPLASPIGSKLPNHTEE